LYCTVTREYAHRSRIHSFASGVFADSRGFSEYYYTFTLEGAKNVITVIDYISHTRLAVIELPEGYEGQVENLAITNGILFATVPAIKTIYAYKLSKCNDFVCPLALQLTPKHLTHWESLISRPYKWLQAGNIRKYCSLSAEALCLCLT
jgi:hypothetical protein